MKKKIIAYLKEHGVPVYFSSKNVEDFVLPRLQHAICNHSLNTDDGKIAMSLFNHLIAHMCFQTP